MDRTQFAGLTELEPGEGLFEAGSTFADVDRAVIDRFLKLGAKTHLHDAHAPTPNPTEQVTITPIAGGGSLPPASSLWATYTLIDAEGGETLPAPPLEGVTAGALPVPAAPSGVVDYTAGTVIPNVYYYVLTALDGLGGETEASDPAVFTVAPGNPNAQILFDGLMTAAAAVGGSSWRLYRSVNGGTFGLLATDSTETFTDDGQPCVDPQMPPPDFGTTASSSSAEVVVPSGVALTDAVAYRLYAAPTVDMFSPALVGEFPIASAGTVHTLQNFGLESGAPPTVSTSVGGAPLIRATTDIDWTGYAGGGGGGGGGAGPTSILPAMPASIEWVPTKAEMDAASVHWDLGLDPGGSPLTSVAVLARMVETGQYTDDAYINVWAGLYDVAEWRGDTAEYTWDPTASWAAGGLHGTGAVDDDNIIERAVGAPDLGDGGTWDAFFSVQTGWKRLYAGGLRSDDSGRGFFLVLDHDLAKLQLVEVTAVDPLAYTVLDERDVPVTATRFELFLRLNGSTLYGICPDMGGDIPWLKANLPDHVELDGWNFHMAVGARWATADTAVHITTAYASERPVRTELIASQTDGTTDSNGDPLWSLNNSVWTVLWRSDGYGSGLPDQWQGSWGWTFENGWEDESTDQAWWDRWGDTVVLRGALANPTGFNAGSGIAQLPPEMNPDQDHTFLLPAEDDTGALGIARVTVLRSTLTDPPTLVLDATNLTGNPVRLQLAGVDWRFYPA